MRLADKVAVVVGAGQTPGETIGNGRATATIPMLKLEMCFMFSSIVLVNVPSPLL